MLVYVCYKISRYHQRLNKSHRQYDDPVNRNNYVWQAAAGKDDNYERHHKHFEAFLLCQDSHHFPCYDRDIFPNWKVQPLLQWINFIGHLA